MKVFVLVTADDEESLRSCTLFTESIRVGFPTAEIYVYDNFSKCVGWWPKLKGLDVHFKDLPSRTHHAEWIRDVVHSSSGPIAIVDPDVMWWKSCQHFFELFKDNLVAGYHVPEMYNEWSKCYSFDRLHTSFLVIPNAEALVEALHNVYPLSHKSGGEYCTFDPFYPRVIFFEGTPMFYDTCAAMYQALRVNCGVFSPAELDCYDHLNSASFYQLMCDRVENRGAFIEIHEAAEVNPQKLRGLWKGINMYYARCQEKLNNLKR